MARLAETGGGGVTKYIEIKEAEKAFREAFKNPSEMGNAQAFINVLRHDVPAADVRPVVRGEWKKMPDGACVCSVCQLGLESFTQAIFYNFCPNCGADMRGEY